MSLIVRNLCFAPVLMLLACPVAAEGDPTRRADRLEPLVLDANSGFSVDRYEIQTGVYYRWRIESDGLEEYELVAPELFRESWIDKVSIDDIEVRIFGLQAVEFGDEGTADIWLVVQRPGEYEYLIEGLESEGFRGVFVVR